MNKKSEKHLLRFRKLGITSIIAVYLLILIGGLVRSTGSGMGCPDWPKCFGQWVPPTSAEGLPEDYKSIYAEKRQNKNERLATTLTSLGFERSAILILGDENTYIEDDFNVTKTWIEYLNRLVGVVIGLILFALLLSSIPLINFHNRLAMYSGFIVLLTAFQGWLGSIVVSTNLLPGMITIHMIVALFIIGALIFAVMKTYKTDGLISKSFRSLKLPIVILLIMAFIQIMLGTDVRESIDLIAINNDFLNRGDWIDSLDIIFYIHRSMSWIFIGLTGFLSFRILKDKSISKVEKWFAYFLILIISSEILIGIGMANFGIPPYLQPVHLLFGSLLFGLSVLGVLLAFSSNVSHKINTLT